MENNPEYTCIYNLLRLITRKGISYYLSYNFAPLNYLPQNNLEIIGLSDLKKIKDYMIISGNFKGYSCSLNLHD